MQLERVNQIKESVEQADFVLVGLGEEWILSDEEILDDLIDKDVVLKQIMQHVTEEMNDLALKELCVAYYYENYIPKKLEKAYGNLLHMISKKNYYIVSLAVDSYLIKTGFDKDKIVNPCGTYKLIQCTDACENELLPSDSMLEAFGKVLNRNREIELNEQTVKKIVAECTDILGQHRCGKCHKAMVYNQLGCGQYLEAGYLDNWQRYMKWLQGTLNRHLCVIEAGVGMKLPTVIRWPFEKTVFYNQKSNMIRIHEKYYQVNQEVSERSFGCKCNAVRLFCEENLEAF
ncbi:MAG: hypothetical protein IJZ42_07725 [Lachnospiraceae bacterium]|nr:hypothetical protein [Lachnospiraceae bacterium]